MNNILSYPLSVVLSLTNHCNLNCMHCFSSASETYDTSEEYQRWQKIVPLLAEKKIFKVRYSGGEPLSVPWFQRIAEEVASFNINSGLNTNATYITEDIANWLSKLPMRESIIVGIDGLKASHEKLRGQDTYARAINGLKYLIDKNLNTEMFCVITKLNYTEIIEIYKLAKKMGVKKLNFNKLCLVGRSMANDDILALSKDQLQYVYETILSLDEDDKFMKGVLYSESKLYKQYKLGSSADKGRPKGIGCGNGSKGIVIYSNGDCAPCEMLNEAVCGNIFENNFEDIWKNSKVLNDFRDLASKTVANIDGCKNCKINDKCGGSCRAEPYISGNILGKGNTCVGDLFVVNA